MLVLKRKQGEAIHIGDDVTLTVLAIEGDQVKWELMRRVISIFIGMKCTFKCKKRMNRHEIAPI